MEIAAWPQTLERWKREGLPEHAASGSFMTGHAYFGLEGYDFAPVKTVGPQPPFEKKQFSKMSDTRSLQTPSVGHASH